MQVLEAKNGQLNILISGKDGKSKSYSVSLSSLFKGQIPAGTILKVASGGNDSLWVVTDKDIYSTTIFRLGNGKFSARVDQKWSHTITLPEYKHPPGDVIAADILQHKKRIYVATISNTGIFQAFIIPASGQYLLSEKFNIPVSLPGWPKNVSGALIRLLSPDDFSIIPIGSDPVIQYIRKAPGYDEGLPIETKPLELDHLGTPVRILRAIEPIHFDPNRGGWVVTLECQMKNGSVQPVFSQVMSLELKRERNTEWWNKK